MTRDGYNTYCLYLAIQRHFTTTYDFFKYNGKVKTSINAYQKRNDIFSFEKLAKIVNKEDRLDFFVAHFNNDSKTYIRQMSKTGLELYNNHYKRLPSIFKEDLEYIKQIGVSVFKTQKIFELSLAEDISKETIIILDSIYPFIDKRKDTADFFYTDYIDNLINYRPFVKQKLNNKYNIYVDIARDILLKS